MREEQQTYVHIHAPLRADFHIRNGDGAASLLNELLGCTCEDFAKIGQHGNEQTMSLHGVW